MNVPAQADLFSDAPAQAHYRRTDPSTSREAARLAAANRMEQVVESWLLSRGEHGGTSLECVDTTGYDRVTLSPRFKPLEQRGAIVRTSERRNKSQVWRHRRFA